MFVCLSVCVHFLSLQDDFHTAIQSFHNTEQNVCVLFPKNILVLSCGCVKFLCSLPSLVSIFNSVCLSSYNFNMTNMMIENSHNVHQKSLDIRKMSLLVRYICLKSPFSLPSLKLNSVHVTIDVTACILFRGKKCPSYSECLIACSIYAFTVR